MRKIYNIYVLLVAVVAMAFTSCQGDDNNLDTSNRRGATTFTANFDASRSYFGDKVDGAYPSYWSGDERVMLEIVTSDFLSIRPSESIAMELVDEDGKYASFTATIEQEFNGGSVYAYVPAASWEYGTDSWGISSYSYKLPAVQTPTATSVDPAAHILRAEYIFEGALPTDVDLTFEHVAAYGKLSIPALEGEDVQSVQIDLTGVWGTEYSYTLNVSELDEPTYWFACDSDLIMAIGITAVTADKSYTYERTFESGSEVLFSAGHVRPLTVAGELIDPSQPEPTSPNREIHYTATAKVEADNDYPWTYDTFGANIVSHEWNSETGEGVITFDADVMTIGERTFFYCGTLTSVTIPDSVTTIGARAFYNSDSLTSVTIGNSVTTIGDDAFYDCDSLTSITIPDSVTTIESNAFFGCDSLTSITIGDSVTTIGEYAFYDCDGLTSITIPDSVTTIGDYAFYECDSLTSITIPDSVTTIGKRAFAYCGSLTSVTIGDSVTTIGEWAFRYCDNLTSVYCEATTPPSLDGSYVFDNNASGRTIYVPAASVEAYKSAEGWSKYADAIIAYDFENGVVVEPEVSINNVIHYTATAKVEADNDYPWTYDTFGANIVSHEWNSETGEGVITFDADVTTIGDYAFWWCSSLTSITIPDSVTTIGSYAFYDCSNLVEFNGKFASEDSRCLIVDGTLNSFAPAGLTSYTIPDSVTTIEYEAFAYCDSLTSITIPDSVTTIGLAAFRDCTNLISITIPDSVTTIGGSAFYDCDSLTSVTIPDSVTTIENGTFADCENLINITIPDSVTTIGEYAFCECRSLTSITIPDSVTTIGEWAFGYCGSLASITIGDSVTTIGDGAFYSCDSLASITIGDSVTTIGEDAFYDCDGLTSITIPDSVTTIGDYAFASCSSLTSTTIPDSVTTIGEGAFSDCYSLTSITIPDSVTKIGDYAFSDCFSLTSVYCEATTPPSLGGSHVFDYNASGRKIYVPAASVEAYKTADYWSEYADAIVGNDFENGENDGDPNTITLNTFVYNADLRGNYYGYLFKATAENVELGICIGSKSCSKTSIDAGDYTYNPYPEDHAYAFQLRASNINGTDVSNDPNATMNVAVNGGVYTITIVTNGYTLTYNGTL